MAATKSKILVIGATGYIGKFLALAGPKEGHPTFVLIRPETLKTKPDLIDSFKSSGITILQGSLEDHESLVTALKQVDVVVSAVGRDQMSDQTKIIAAIKEAGNIKRFLPSEFGDDVDRINTIEPVKSLFDSKVQIRRAVEEADIPYTYVLCHGFAGFFFSNLLQPGYYTSPPRDKLMIFGSGDNKFISVDEKDIGTYTIRAADDPRTLNKKFHIRPAKNIVTLNELVELWEKKIGKTLEKERVTEEQMKNLIPGAPFPFNLFLAYVYGIVTGGICCDFELGEQDVEATSLYPDIRYVSADEYLHKYV